METYWGYTLNPKSRASRENHATGALVWSMRLSALRKHLRHGLGCVAEIRLGPTIRIQ